MKKILLLSGTVIALAACSEKTSVSAVEPAVEENVEVAMTVEANAGKQIFEAKCQRCHGLKNVDDYTADQWSKILPNMAKKAKLEPEETAKVDAYVSWELEH